MKPLTAGPGFCPTAVILSFWLAARSLHAKPPLTPSYGSLDSKETKLLFHTHYQAAYASGHLLFLLQSSLMAQPFDVERFELTGEAVPIAEQVREIPALPTLGSLLPQMDCFSTPRVRPRIAQLLWFDRNGKPNRTVPEKTILRRQPCRDGKSRYYLDGTGLDVWSLISPVV